MTDRKKVTDFDPRIPEVFGGYVPDKISRRDFMAQAAQFASVGLSVAATFQALKPDYALAQQVPPDDPAIRVGTVSHDSPADNGRMSDLMARSTDAQGKRSAVQVVHD